MLPLYKYLYVLGSSCAIVSLDETSKSRVTGYKGDSMTQDEMLSYAETYIPSSITTYVHLGSARLLFEGSLPPSQYYHY